MRLLRYLWPKVHVSDLPRTMETDIAGELRLSIHHLIDRADGLAYVREDQLMPGNEVKLTWAIYEPVVRKAPILSFHPPARGVVDIQSWERYFDKRSAQLLRIWRPLFCEQISKITKLFREYGEYHDDGFDFVRYLEMKRLKISFDEPAEFIFEPAKPFDSLNLNVLISRRDRIAEVYFDG